MSDDSTTKQYDPFSGLPVPGGLSERLWNDTQAEVQQSLHHPFVTALAAGTLPRCGSCWCACRSDFRGVQQQMCTLQAVLVTAWVSNCYSPQHWS